jgi:peptide deformylase
MHMEASDLTGKRFAEDAVGYLARIWQHEFDHLNGTLLTDRMGPVAKLANRRILRELEEAYEKEQGGRKKPCK